MRLQAKRIMTVANMDANRDTWLDIRRKSITGTDAGTIMGVNPYDTPFSLFHRKIGTILENVTDSEVMYWGRQLEDIVAREFTAQTGIKLKKCGMMGNKWTPFRVADVDRLFNTAITGGLECKTTTAYNAKAWADDAIPKHYWYQCLHYILTLYCDNEGKLLVNPAPTWCIACLIGGQHYVYRTIEYTQSDLYQLARAETDFYQRIKDRNPPPVSDSKIDMEVLAQLDGGHATIEASEYIEDLIDDIKLNDMQAKEYAKHVQKAKNKLAQWLVMGNADTGISCEYKVTYKAPKQRETCAMADIKAHPEIYQKLKEMGIIKTLQPTKRLVIKDIQDTRED